MTAPSIHPTSSPPPSPADAPRSFRLSRRWDRTGRLLGDEAMERLARARVIVFGLGGVGSYAVEGLVRSGVGHITLVDFDEVCVTNLNRQLHATVRTVGKSKAELMAQRCREVNPDCTVEAVAEFYRAETSEQLLQPGWDYVVDAIDNVKAKLHLLNRCVQLGLPVVSSMGAADRHHRHLLARAATHARAAHLRRGHRGVPLCLPEPGERLPHLRSPHPGE